MCAFHEAISIVIEDAGDEPEHLENAKKVLKHVKFLMTLWTDSSTFPDIEVTSHVFEHNHWLTLWSNILETTESLLPCQFVPSKDLMMIMMIMIMMMI